MAYLVYVIDTIIYIDRSIEGHTFHLQWRYMVIRFEELCLLVSPKSHWMSSFLNM